MKNQPRYLRFVSLRPLGSQVHHHCWVWPSVYLPHVVFQIEHVSTVITKSSLDQYGWQVKVNITFASKGIKIVINLFIASSLDFPVQTRHYISNQMNILNAVTDFFWENIYDKSLSILSHQRKKCITFDWRWSRKVSSVKQIIRGHILHLKTDLHFKT